MNLKHKNESGRSMVEMLGTLAIIGVLSIGGIAGYNYGMDKYRTNETIQDIQLRMTDLIMQLSNTNHIEPNLSNTWGTQGKFYPMDVVIDDSGDPIEYPLEVSNIPKRVCEMIFDSLISSYSIEISSTRYTENTNEDICNEDNTMAFYLTDLYQCQDGYANGLTCINNEYCLPSMVCGATCCTPEKSLCQDGQCIAVENKECETNSDCGTGYWCQVGTKSDCSENTNPINKCQKITAKQEIIGQTKYAVSPSGSYTYFDSVNYCAALGMRLFSQNEFRKFGASNSSFVETNTPSFNYGAFSSTQKSSCVHYHWTPNTTEADWSTNDNKTQNLVYCLQEVGESCDVGFEYDNQTGDCSCATNLGCFQLNPNKAICHEKECVQCLTNNDCTSNANTPYCDINSHTCVECINHDQCITQASKSYCTNNVCSQCYSDEDCRAVSGKPYCNADGICTACYKSEHCSSSQYCKQTTNGWGSDVSCFDDNTFSGTCTSMPSYSTFTTSNGVFAKSSNSYYTYMSSLNFCEALAIKTGENWKMPSIDDVGCSRAAPDRWWNCTGEFFLNEISPKVTSFWATGLNSTCNGWYFANRLVDTVPKGDHSYLGTPTYALCIKN